MATDHNSDKIVQGSSNELDGAGHVCNLDPRDWQVQLLFLLQTKLAKVERHVDENRRGIAEVERKLEIVNRLRNDQERGDISMEELRRVTAFLRRTISRFDKLAQELTDCSVGCVDVRRKIAFLEEVLNREENPELSEEEVRNRLMTVALDSMQRADEILGDMEDAAIRIHGQNE